jgi:type IV pilus assembly protein PilA
MLPSRSIHKLFLQRIPLLKNRFLYGKLDATSAGTQHNIRSGIRHGLDAIAVGTRQCRVLTIIRLITALTLPIVFSTASVAQVAKTTKAKESAAKQYVVAMNRAQQAYYEQNTGFTSSVTNLNVGLEPDKANYGYSISTGNKAVFNYAVSKQVNLKSFVGGVFLVGTKIETILCQTNAGGTAKPANPTNKNGVLTCGANTVKVANK